MIKCPKHPKYKGVRLPTTKMDCFCHDIYAAMRDGYDLRWVYDSKGTKQLMEFKTFGKIIWDGKV